MKYQVGDYLGHFLLLDTDGRKWTAKCTCGHIWTTRSIRLKNRNDCPQCTPPRTFRHYKVGEVLNKNTLLERLPTKKWKAQCHCGAIRICSPCDLNRYQNCKACYDPEVVARQHRLPGNQTLINAKHRTYQRGARDRKYSWELSKQEFQDYITQPCSYCGLTGLNGIDRVDNTLGYTLSNCVPCCSFCNHAKKDYTLVDFTNHIKRICEYQFRDYPARE